MQQELEDTQLALSDTTTRTSTGLSATSVATTMADASDESAAVAVDVAPGRPLAPDAAASNEPEVAMPELGKRHTQLEPSEQAEHLKVEYARLKRRRMRWGGIKPAVAAPSADHAADSQPESASTSIDTLVLRIGEINLLLRLPEADGPERVRLLRTRVELVRAFCAIKYAWCDVGPGQLMSLKLILPDHPTSGGPLGMVGVVIGPRGRTQKRMQAETGTSIIVRGKGTRKPGDSARDESDDEPPHILIRGPTTQSLDKARALLETLLDFSSPEGERMRSEATAELRILNGTARESDTGRRGAVDMTRVLAGRGLGSAAAERGVIEAPGRPPWCRSGAVEAAPWNRSAATEAAPVADAMCNGEASDVRGMRDEEYAKLITEVGGMAADEAAPAASVDTGASPAQQVLLQTPPPPPQHHVSYQPLAATASAGAYGGSAYGGHMCSPEALGTGAHGRLECGAGAYSLRSSQYAAQTYPHAHYYQPAHGVSAHGFTHPHTVHPDSCAGASESGVGTCCGGAAASWVAPVEEQSPGGMPRARPHTDAFGSAGLPELCLPGMDVGLGMGGLAAAAGMSGEAGSSWIARLGFTSTSGALSEYAMV